MSLEKPRMGQSTTSNGTANGKGQKVAKDENIVPSKTKSRPKEPAGGRWDSRYLACAPSSTTARR